MTTITRKINFRWCFICSYSTVTCRCCNAVCVIDVLHVIQLKCMFFVSKKTLLFIFTLFDFFLPWFTINNRIRMSSTSQLRPSDVFKSLRFGKKRVKTKLKHCHHKSLQGTSTDVSCLHGYLYYVVSFNPIYRNLTVNCQ